MVSSEIYGKDIQKFAHLIRRKCVHGVTVVLYACSCGKIDYPGGSFAAKLAVALRDMGATVFGHHNVGHTTTNANLYRYSSDGRGVLVAPIGKFTAFNRMMKAESIDEKPRGNTALWARVPFMTPDEIRAEVARWPDGRSGRAAAASRSMRSAVAGPFFNPLAIPQRTSPTMVAFLVKLIYMSTSIAGRLAGLEAMGRLVRFRPVSRFPAQRLLYLAEQAIRDFNDRCTAVNILVGAGAIEGSDGPMGTGRTDLRQRQARFVSRPADLRRLRCGKFE